jgi:hypothetical protein
MADYRFCHQHGKILTPPTVLQRRNDDEAIPQAPSIVGDFPVEIWDGGRRGGTLERRQIERGR